MRWKHHILGEFNQLTNSVALKGMLMNDAILDSMKQLILERIKQGQSFRDISRELSVNAFIVAAVALSASK
jgi:predicted DNA-binding ArsR family transcriptional regulator